MRYIKGNFDFIQSFIEAELPQLSLVHPESTYLAWIDFSQTGLSDDEIKRKLIHEAGVGFQRMNLATNRELVLQAMERIATAFKK